MIKSQRQRVLLSNMELVFGDISIGDHHHAGWPALLPKAQIFILFDLGRKPEKVS